MIIIIALSISLGLSLGFMIGHQYRKSRSVTTRIMKTGSEILYKDEDVKISVDHDAGYIAVETKLSRDDMEKRYGHIIKKYTCKEDCDHDN